MIWPIILLVPLGLLISYYHKKIVAEEEEELKEFYRTCFETEAIMDRHYQRLVTKRGR